MAKWEKAVTVLCFAYVIAYAVYFFTVVMAPGVPESQFLAPLHFLAMALSLIMVTLVVRDVYRRPFSDPNAKATWALLVVFAGIVTIPIYLWKYGFHPRPEPHGHAA